ncbi:unnamed protein product [Polarella glacialis]|uniref:Uncharacterized protein n=1 Tax=Polarella glacialis TaxID=89957 RepID=A0A813GYJ0_POLGL|nr:unnamed protein product [Polarella glacialis]
MGGASRDVFPLPRFECSRAPLLGLSRGVSQRLRRNEAVFKAADESVRSLNELYGCGGVFSAAPATGLDDAQHRILKRIVQAHRRLHKPVDLMTPQEAAKELLQAEAGYSEPAETTCVPFELSKLSLPIGQIAPVPLEQVLNQHDSELLRSFETSMLLSHEEWASVVEATVIPPSYWDPKLKNSRKAYLGLVKVLFDAKVVKFTKVCIETIGLFTVKKKLGRQRLICDARRPNARFRSAPSMRLCSAASFSEIGIDLDESLWIAQADVKDYFYRLGLPIELWSYFCLEPVTKEELISLFGMVPEGFSLEDGESLWPCLAVVPQGWSCAFYLSQQAHGHIAETVLPGIPCLEDNKPCPCVKPGQPFRVTYADNGAIVGVDRESVDAAQKLLNEKLESLGLCVHDVCEAETLATLLGFEFNGVHGRVQPTSHRLWKLHQALLYIESGNKISSKQLQRLVGHAMFMFLICRPLLCIFFHVYRFIEAEYAVPVRPWESIQKECRWARSLLPLLFTDVKLGWSSLVQETDSCFSGYGVVYGQFDIQLVKKVGRWDERWRFRAPGWEKHAPRDVALEGLDVLSDIRTVRSSVCGEQDREWHVDDKFPEVDSFFHDGKNWQHGWSSPWSVREKVHIGEARGVVSCIRARARDLGQRNSHGLVLCDNLGDALAFSKGRCKDFALLLTIRRAAALQVAANIRIRVRWIPSELNWADAASRRWEPKCPTYWDGTLWKSAKQLAGDGGEAPHLRNNQSATAPRSRAPPGLQELNRWCAAKGVEGEESETSCRQSEEGHLEEEKRPSNTNRVNERPRPNLGELREASGNVLNVVLREWVAIKSGGSGKGGQADGGVLRPLVHRRKRRRCWREDTCRMDGIAPTLCKRRLGPSPCPAWTQGMEEGCSGWHPPSVPSIGLCCNSRLNDHKWTQGHGALRDDCLLNLRASWGDSPSPWHGCDSSDSTFPAPHNGVGALRAGHQLEGRAVRRCHPVGRSRDALAGEAATDAGVPQAGPRLVGLLDERLGPDIRAALLKSGFRENDLLSLPDEAWRRLARQIRGETKSGCSAAPRQVECSIFIEAIRKARQSAAYPEQNDSFAQGVWQESPATFPRDVLREAALAPTSDVNAHARRRARSRQEAGRPLTFLSLFAGSEHAAQAAVKAGHQAIAIDITHGHLHDLTKPSVILGLSVLIMFGVVDYIGLDMCCQSWSRARRWDGGPPPLREDTGPELWGRFDLHHIDKNKVALGNRLLFVTGYFMCLCSTFGIPGYVENPFHSRCWLTQFFRDVSKSIQAHSHEVHYCQYGTRWKKPTRFLMWGKFVELWCPKQCHSHSHKCTRTGQSHIVLSGKVDGKYRTLLAQPYPKLLCEELIRTLGTAALEAIS